jgi:hypothetical protein
VICITGGTKICAIQHSDCYMRGMSQKPSTAVAVFSGVVSGLTLVYLRGGFDRPGVGWPTLGEALDIAWLLLAFGTATVLVVRLWDYLRRGRQ